MKRALIVVALIATLLLAAMLVLVLRGAAEQGMPPSTLNAKNLAEMRERGAYLARVGNCRGCHTTPDGIAFAGGRELPTPFGTFITPNITPDRDSGLGGWSADDFWRAMHDGKGPGGRLLYPAFPYTEYTRVTRADTDAIYAYLQSLPAVKRKVAANRLDFPYNMRSLLYLWRGLYFSAGVHEPVEDESAEWNRGAYLVQGLGHCNACHVTRNALGAAGGAALGGGQVAGRSWYAPALNSRREAGSSALPVDEIAHLLATGLYRQGAASGPMAEVVADSLQYLTPQDLRSMALYLKSLPEYGASGAPPLSKAARERVEKGSSVYAKHCKDCHGENGEGAPDAYPPLADNRSVRLASPLNAIRSVLDGGYSPSTANNPRPYGMPPFAQTLSNEEVAQVVSYIRNAWGNHASLVTAVQVDKSGSD